MINLRLKTKFIPALAGALCLALVSFIPPSISFAGPHAPGTNVILNGTVYFIDASGKRPYTSSGAFLSYLFNSFGKLSAASAEDRALPTEAYVAPRDGSLINDNGTVYLITQGQRAGFASEGVFRGLGYSFENVRDGDVSFLPVFSVINSADIAHLPGTIINDSGTIYIAGVANKIGIPSETVFNSWGISFEEAVLANQFDRAMPRSASVLIQRPATELNVLEFLNKPVNSPNSNEPAGMTFITDRRFNSIASDKFSDPSNLAEGWDYHEEAQWLALGHISIVSDPTAPRSPSNVIQMLYPAGTTGGSANATPARMTKSFPPSKYVYASAWVKWSSNFQGNGTKTNKIFYIWINGQPRFFVSAEGSGSGALAPTGRLQGTMDQREALPPNMLSGAELIRGQWQHLEVLVKANTPGQSNGEFSLWLNGQKVSQYSNVGYLAAGESGNFETMDVEPIWGGAGSTVAADQYIWFDDMYVSVK